MGVKGVGVKGVGGKGVGVGGKETINTLYCYMTLYLSFLFCFVLHPQQTLLYHIFCYRCD